MRPTLEAMVALHGEAIRLEALWGIRPAIFLACGGYADEHWQLWHPDDLGPDQDEPMPCLLVHPDGSTERHPDAAWPT